MNWCLRLWSYGLVILVCSLPGKLFADQPASASQQVEDMTFAVAAGYEVEVVADSTMTTWPMLVDWAANGDLLVVESGGVAMPIAEHNKKLLHRVVRLSDRDGDGRFDSRVVVADKLPFTEGILCVGEDILIAAPPHILKLSRPDASGVYQERAVWFDGQTITNCANDLHGPFLGHDGWIYWCKGAFGQQTHELLNGRTMTSTAAHVFRRRLSGGPIEPVITGGMDNPNGFAMTPEGERFFTSTFLYHPGAGRRDGIVHAIYGGVHGKPHQVLDGHLRTGPLMPVTVELGAAAPAGLSEWATEHSPFRDSSHRVLIAALYNLQKVTAHRLIPVGASFQTENLDLLVADRIDFHPTDVLPDADGSLLIVDTGGWYDLCCPTSRVDQKAANGGIYRLSRTGMSTDLRHPAKRTASHSRNVASLVSDLVDTRRWVARSAQFFLQELSATADDPAILEQLSRELAARVNDSSQLLEHRLAWLWGLSQMASDDSLNAIERILTSDENALVLAACHALSVNRFRSSARQLEWLVTSDRPLAVRRAAAEALGRIGDDTSANTLFSLAATNMTDRHWQHSLTYALLELEATDEAKMILANPNAKPTQWMTAVIVLDQLGQADNIPAGVMVRLVGDEDAFVHEQAITVLARHPDWGDRFQQYLLDWFVEVKWDDRGLIAVVNGWREREIVKLLVGNWLENANTFDPLIQDRLRRIFLVYAQQSIPEAWEQSLANWLNGSDHEFQVELAIATSRCNVSENGPVSVAIRELARQQTDVSRRLDFLATLPKGSQLDDRELEQSILDGLLSDNSRDKSRAVAAVTRVTLSRDSATKLLVNMDRLDPTVLAAVVPAISRVQDDDMDRQMLSSLSTLASAKTLPLDQLSNLFQHRTESLKELAAATIAQLQQTPNDVSAEVDRVLAALPDGDALRGLQLFRSSKASCSACHRLGYVGGEIGPELSTIGRSRSRRALAEAILFPNARLEQGYYPTKILTSDGRVFSGLVGQQVDSESFSLQVSADQAVVIRYDEVELQEPGTVSIMPSGIGEVLTPQELADLLAILEAAK